MKRIASHAFGIWMFLYFLGNLYALDMDIRVQGTVSWQQMRVRAASTLDLDSAALKLPTGRAQGEELADMEFPRLIRPILLRLPVDSSTRLVDLIDRGEYSLTSLDAVIQGAQKKSAFLSTDLRTLSSEYTIDLTHITAELIRHRYPSQVRQPLVPSPTRTYTGIIIIADEALPIHGKTISARAEPCLFPKVWDTDMNCIYERNMVESERARDLGIVRYSTAASILRSTPSGLDPELQALVGREPLRILARGLFGVRATDPIIDRQDALSIISSEENIRLLREGRVLIILPEEALEWRF